MIIILVFEDLLLFFLFINYLIQVPLIRWRQYIEKDHWCNQYFFWDREVIICPKSSQFVLYSFFFARINDDSIICCNVQQCLWLIQMIWCNENLSNAFLISTYLSCRLSSFALTLLWRCADRLRKFWPSTLKLKRLYIESFMKSGFLLVICLEILDEGVSASRPMSVVYLV